MNQILIDYCKRFEQTGKPENYIRPVFDEFFTNLNVSAHWEKLPYLHNIQNFCLRLLLAQLRSDKICIYSDYDTDAVTATAVMYHGLLDLGFDPNNVEFYAPDRFTEGYGMNTEAIDALSQKFDLIISVDCGINSWKEADIVKVNNLKYDHRCDLIITDHHHLTDNIPDCVAVINCRMAEVYFQKPDELKGINQDILNQIQTIVKSAKEIAALPQGSDKILITNLHTWLVSTSTQPQEYQINPSQFLSQSVTGVGVAWFCLVWYTYFLEFLQESSDL